MYFNPRVIPSLKVESFNYNIHDTETIDLTQSSSNDEVIDLTGSFNNDEIIDLTQTSSDESTTHFSTSSNDEMDTSPDDDDDYIPPQSIGPLACNMLLMTGRFKAGTED